MRRLALTLILTVAVAGMPGAQGAKPAPPGAAEPVLVLETAKGTVTIRLFRSGAPKSVDHIVALVNRSWYRAQRVHRVNATLVQFGDPGTRDMSKRGSWGAGNSGNPIGVAEIIKGRTHQRGAVGLAHGGNPAYADSQLYIMKAASPGLDGKHAVIGQVLTGMDVVDKLAVADLLKNVYIRK